jgi:phosphoenolpyruvate phosphomutase
VYAENAFNALGGALLLKPLDAKGLLCSEIDNEEDLAVVRRAFAGMEPCP